MNVTFFTSPLLTASMRAFWTLLGVAPASVSPPVELRVWGGGGRGGEGRGEGRGGGEGGGRVNTLLQLLL